MKETFHIGVFGLNHNSAPLGIRERLYVSESAVPELLQRFKEGGVGETLIISTCNRTEIYYSCNNCDKAVEIIKETLKTKFAVDRERLDPYVYVFHDEDAYKHLFRVASGLDSMIVGEPQILGQVKDAYRLATAHGSTGFLLNKVFHRTFSVAKRVRSETRIGYNPVSISSMAVELSKKIFLDLSRKKILVIGAGEMCEIALKHFKKEGLSEILITNRTFQGARKLAEEYVGVPYPFTEMGDLLTRVDMILSSTGSEEPIITKSLVQAAMKKRKNRPLFFIDIAVPRDVDPEVNRVENVYLYDIDDLKDLSQRHLSDRLKESEKAHAIMDEEAAKFSDWLSRLDMAPLIAKISHKVEAMRSTEVKKALSRMKDVDEETAGRIEAMSKAIISKLLHPHLALIKNDGSPEVVEVMKRLFDLEDEDEEEEMDTGYEGE